MTRIHKFLGSARVMNSGRCESCPVRSTSFSALVFTIAFGFCDGHVESMKPAQASLNNRLWNGCNDPRAKPVLPEPPVNWPADWRRNIL